MIAAEILNTNFFGIYLRFLKRKDEKRFGHIQYMKIIMIQMNTYVEWSLRVILIIVSFF